MFLWEPMIGWHGDHGAVPQRGDRQVMALEREGREADFELPGDDAIADHRRRQTIDHDLEPWALAAEFGEEARQKARCQRRKGRDLQRSALAGAKILGEVTNL